MTARDENWDCESQEWAEIRALSPEARGLILHRLRNTLQIASANVELIRNAAVEHRVYVDSLTRLTGNALDACRRLDREINDLFGGDHA